MTRGLTSIDGVVLVGYLLGITLLGVWMARKIKNLSDYFMPRRFGKWMMVMHSFGTGTASDQAVVVASATFRSGISGIWYQWLWLFVTPFYWLIAPIMRRFRAVTTADVFELRYDRSVAMLFAAIGCLSLAVKIGVLLKGAGALIEASTGGMVQANLAIPIVTVLFVVYGIAGGLAAAIVTDFIQGLLTLIFSFILLPFVMGAVGGMSGIRETIQDPQMLSLVAPGEIGILFIIMFSVQALVGIVAQPFVMGMCAAGKSEMEGRVGFMLGNFAKRLCTIAWCLTGIAAVAWHMQRGTDPSLVNPDNVYGEMAAHFLPALAPGLLGVFIAALVASVMSSCDAYMISSAALVTENIYRPLKPGRSENHYLKVGRIATLAVVAGGVAFAFWLPNVIKGLSIWFKIAPMLGIAFWLGLFWKRATTAGAWASTLAGFGTWWLTTQDWFLTMLVKLVPTESYGIVLVGADSLSISEPWQILFYLSSAAGIGILVSLGTSATSDEKLDRFYSLVQTPVQNGEVIERSCTLPSGVKPVKRKMIFENLGLHLPMPSRTSVVGFLIGCAGVGIMIVGFVWIVRYA